MFTRSWFPFILHARYTPPFLSTFVSAACLFSCGHPKQPFGNLFEIPCTSPTMTRHKKTWVIKSVVYIGSYDLIHMPDDSWSDADVRALQHRVHNVADARANQSGYPSPFQKRNAFRRGQVFCMQFTPCQFALMFYLENQHPNGRVKNRCNTILKDRQSYRGHVNRNLC